jgi:Icc protein
MPCCHLSRRQFLALAAAAAVPLGVGFDPRRAWAATGSPVIAQSLELVTLTESSVVLTWTTFQIGGTPDSTGRLPPAPADTVVYLGTSPTSLVQVVGDDTQTPYHYAEITGLAPNQQYFYVALSNGIPALAATAYQGNPAGTASINPGAGALASPFSFMTPEPPPGRFLFSLALANDVHMGETVAGLATTLGDTQVPPGIMGPVEGQPYPEVMAEALAADVVYRSAARTLIAGDLTAEAAQVDALRAKQLLDAIGTLGTDYLVGRGNHDRPHATSPAVAACSMSPYPGYNDCYYDVFGHQDANTWFTRSVGGMRLICLDTYDKGPDPSNELEPGNGSDNGMLGTAQYNWFAETLADDPDVPTLVFGHHPITVESSLENTEPVRFDLYPPQALMIEELYQNAPGVFFHQAGHTHRNKRSVGLLSAAGDPLNPQVSFQETSATKEYPGGFSLLRVYSGGYALNFYKFRSQLALEWSDRTRQEYAGVNPFYTNGTTADRNYVVSRDLSDLTPAAPTGPVAATPEVGMTVALPLAAAAAATAAVLVSRYRHDDPFDVDLGVTPPQD